MKTTTKNSILIIDDEPANIIALRQILSPEYIVYGATDGKTGITAAKSKSPDVILLDIIMPYMDGYEILSILKKNTETINTPVIFITGLRGDTAEEKGLDLGADDYIVKPFNSSNVLLRVRNLMKTVNRTHTINEHLKQQALMTKISHSFVSDVDLGSLLTGSLRMVGEFLDVARVLLYEIQDDSKVLICRNEWLNPIKKPKTQIGEIFELNDMIDEVISKILKNEDGYTCLHSNNPVYREAMKPHRTGYPCYITVPIFIKGEIKAVLDFSGDDPDYQWDESEIDLVVLLSNVFSGAFEREAMERQSSIVEHTTNLALYITSDAIIEYVNPAVESITGYTRQELISKGFGAIISERVLSKLKNTHITNAMTGETIQFELGITRKDGEKRILMVSIVKTSDDHLGLIANDLTEIRKLEAGIVLAMETAEKNRELAEQSSRAKSEFLSRMSHEMLTPMNAIIGMSQIAMTSGVNNKTLRCLEEIDKSSKQLFTMIRDVLDMSGGSGSFSLDTECFSIKKMIGNIIKVITPELDKKHQRLSTFISSDMPDLLIGDDKRITRVIHHLLTNAIKFSPEESEIWLNFSIQEEEREIILLRVEVEDNGIGISPEEHQSLFNMFEQADGSVNRSYGGMGIGLPLSRCIVELMGGDIWVESEPSKGAKFIFTCKLIKDT